MHPCPGPTGTFALFGLLWGLGVCIFKIRPAPNPVILKGGLGYGALARTDHADWCGFLGNEIITQQPLGYPDLVYNCPAP